MEALRRVFPSRFNYTYTAPGETAGAAPSATEAVVDVEPVSFADCRIEWRDRGATLSVALADLDPQSVRAAPRRRPDTTFSVEVWDVSLTAKGEARAITERKGDGGEVNTYTGLDLQYDSREKAEAVADALRKAVQLCDGGRRP